MKLAYFNDFQIGVVSGDGIVDITALLSAIAQRDNRDLMAGLIAEFEVYKPRIEALLSKAAAVPLSSVRLRAPLPRPRQIVCMAVNYMEDGTLPEAPPINAFHKSPGAIIGQGERLVLPDVGASVFEGEAELAVVIGKRACNVSAADALSHIFGYVNFIDGSARGLPPANNVFFQAKSRDTFAPIGPYIVTADEIADPQNLKVQLWINETLKQSFNTSDMAHSIARSIEWVSSIHTLEPGDILATGTNHRGLSALHDGDVVALEVEGLGRLSVQVVDELRRTWDRRTRFENSLAYTEQTGNPAPPTGIPAAQLSGKYKA